MTKRTLGAHGPQVAPLAFGGNVFGWTANESMSFKLLDRFVDAGFNLIDTADVYSKWAPGNAGGESETILGNWLQRRGKRDDILIATKVGNPMAPDKTGLRATYIAQAVEDSLRRLRTDYIDLYQSHNPDPHTPVEETLGAYARLIEQGKIRMIGASNHDAPTLSAALAVSKRDGLPRFEVIQPLYNLYDRDQFEGALADLCAAEGIGVINYYALASGFLTGKYRHEQHLAGSARQSNKKYLNERGLRILAALDEVSAGLGAKPGQIAIAWLLANPVISAPIASATSLAQLEELIAATRITLPPDALARLDRASAPDAAPG